MRLQRLLPKPLVWLHAVRQLASAAATNLDDATRAHSVTGGFPKQTGTNTDRTPLKMAGWQIHNYGEVEDLQYSSNLRVPQIRGATDCLVRVRSTSVNPIDVAMLRGYGATVLNVLRCQGGPAAIEFPLTLGREFCGELVQCGMDPPKGLRVGQRVWGVVPVERPGAHAEYVSVSKSCIAPAPAELTDEQAAAVLYTGLTAWSGLYITGQLGGLCGALCSSGGGGANKRVLVLGGSGSVGSLAIQMLKAHGVQVVATCNADAVALVQHTFGADHVIDYGSPEAMSDLARYQPYDIILDCAGQGAEGASALNVKFRQYITFSSPLLRNIDQSGLAVGLMQNAANLVETNARALMQHGGLIKWGFFAPAPHGIEFLSQLVARKKLLPTIDSSFRVDQLPAAFAKVQAGHLRGKVVVNFN